MPSGLIDVVGRGAVREVESAGVIGEGGAAVDMAARAKMVETAVRRMVAALDLLLYYLIIRFSV